MPRQPREEPDERLEDAPLLLLRRQRRDPILIMEAEFGQQTGENGAVRADQCLHLTRTRATDVLSDGIEEGGEREIAVVLLADTGEELEAGARRAHRQLAQQAALADPRLAGEQEEGAPPARGLVKKARAERQFPLPADDDGADTRLRERHPLSFLPLTPVRVSR